MSRHLEHLHIDRFGSMVDRSVGPFDQGLNVVYGPNEAGKSTVASFIGGTLFGWEEAHGVRNTYRPAEGERSGSLTFSDGSTVFRGDNGLGLQGDTQLVDDIDNVTFRTMFFLTSDELRSLRNTSDVTARLLTASSGTGTSPARAYVEVEQRIAALTSRSADAECSIFNLGDQLDRERDIAKHAGEETELRKREYVELRELREDRAIAARHLSDVNRVLEKLRSCRTRIEGIDAQLGECKQELSTAETERANCILGTKSETCLDPRLMKLDNTDERLLRDRLDEFAEEQAKATRGVEIAKENAAASTAAYEALVEMDSGSAPSKSARRAKNSLAALPAMLAIAFTFVGIPVFIHARAINSLALTALGIGLVVFAFLLAIATVALVARPDRSAEALDARRSDAQWVMLQDKKKLETSTAAKQLIDADIAAYLEERGLAAANGSIRQARALLDDAREARASEQALNQRVAALDMRIATEQATLERLSIERAELLESLGLDAQGGLDEIDAEIEVKEEQRTALSQTCDDMGVRIGELTERLDQARTDRSFDLAKLRHQQTRVRLRDAKRELITLLLAKSMLEQSIAAWESRSQPEVYRKASELFAAITGGAWRQISMTSEGQIIVTSSDGTVRQVRHLSLGTCQQLYLSLRIAMLIHADNVGRSIPVIADDILVHFDAERRRGAARALAELAEKRQVIVFTGHRETAEALRDAQPNLNMLEL